MSINVPQVQTANAIANEMKSTRQWTTLQVVDKDIYVMYGAILSNGMRERAIGYVKVTPDCETSNHSRL